jgi:hypothetical protein
MLLVMHSSAKMPSSCWGRYRRVALVEWDPYAVAARKGIPTHKIDWSRPTMIKAGTHNIVRIVREQNCNVGKTEKDAFSRCLGEYDSIANRVNNDQALGELLISTGSA